MSKDLWVFKYAPKKLDEMVITDEKKQLLQKIIDELPTCLIHGSPGTGKGTFMDILIKDTGCDYLKINASMENSIDDVRNKINKFATSFSMTKKVVYLNEADRLSVAGQDAIRQLQEDTHKICSFFFVCNNVTKITDAIKSRCGYEVSLNDPPGKPILSHCLKILKSESVKVESKSAIVDVIKKLYPDIRKIIGTLQSNVRDGKISKISFSTTTDLYRDIFKLMKEQDIDGLRKILRSNYIEYDQLYKYIYEQIMQDPDNVNNPGEALIMTGEYLYRDYFAAIKEVNFVAFFFNLMKKGVL